VERGLPILMDAACRAAYRVEVQGLENLTRAPSTLIVANHRRDADAPLIAGLFLDRKGLTIRGELPYFVAREDLFHRGFLFNYLQHWPSFMRYLLGHLDLGSILRDIHAYPMRRVPERTLGEVLEDVRLVLGDQPLDQVLRPPCSAAFRKLSGQGSGRLWLHDALAPHFTPLLQQYYGLRRLNRDCFHAILPYEESVILSQLQGFVKILEQGRSLLLEPEGLVSETGEFLRIRRGVHFLVNTPRVPVHILPVGIAYDFMSEGRQRVFIRIGPEIRNLKGVDHRQVSQRVTDAILREVTATTSEIASHVLMKARRAGVNAVSTGYLIEAVRAAATRHAAAGVRVDPQLLDSEGSAPRVHSFLHFCRRQDILERVAANRWRLNGSRNDAAACYSDPAGAIARACNELRSLEQLHPELTDTAAG
jgi:1-acyl-sn-glycerol-3-phosphate acyltransferase